MDPPLNPLGDQFLNVVLRVLEVPILAPADLGLSEGELGLAGSYTQVVKVFPPQPKKGGVTPEGLEPAAAASEIAAFLRSEGYVG